MSRSKKKDNTMLYLGAAAIAAAVVLFRRPTSKCSPGEDCFVQDPRSMWDKMFDFGPIGKRTPTFHDGGKGDLDDNRVGAILPRRRIAGYQIIID